VGITFKGASGKLILFDIYRRGTLCPPPHPRLRNNKKAQAE